MIFHFVIFENNNSKIILFQFKTIYFEVMSYCCKHIHTSGKRCRKTVYSKQKRNHYICEFGDSKSSKEQKYINHPNRDIYCKQHIFRKIIPFGL